MKRIIVGLVIPVMLVTLLVSYPVSSAAAQEEAEASLGPWAARVEYARGVVEARRAGEVRWVIVQEGDVYCFGDSIRTRELSKAGLDIGTGPTLHLDENSTITFREAERKETILIKLLRGAAHFLSRGIEVLSVDTPFLNGDVEGTEFLVKVERDRSLIVVFQGQVVATNDFGTLSLESGQSAIALEGQAPASHILARPRDAVQWALYYPPILYWRAADFPGGAETDWQSMVRRSIEFYWEGDLAGAFSSLAEAPEDISDPRFFTYRAALLLSVGRVDEASADIEEALHLDSANSHAFALWSIIAVVQNEKDKALGLARKAAELDTQSSAARVAASYAQQAHFNLQGALASLQEAVELDPENPLAWARLAELLLSVGNLDRAVEAAKKAVALDPNIARTQTVLGFAYLTQIKIRDSKNAFERAIELDQAAPLPRLGLGLAKIRDGELEEGRRHIEIAASLDPNRSLVRSYLGKSYFEERRDKGAGEEFVVARELDPLDPTPWFYDAIRKQTVNRPVEGLQDLQKSIELNDNRAVYRSRLLLDEDLAARSAALARTHVDLGFEQLALVEGWKSLNVDPANYSGHRLLADLYSSQPRHQIARVSELLQSQLLQPVNITPVRPQLAETDLFILEGAGPTNPSFNEFNPLFYRDRLALQVNSVVGDHDTVGDEVAVSGVEGRLSYSIGQFHYETDGFRENNDLEQDIYNAFVQMSLSHKTTVQAEFRYTDREEGDLRLRFDPENFVPTLRQDEQTRSARLGLHHAFTSHSDVIASFIYRSDNFGMDEFPDFSIESEEDGYIAEVQHLFRSELFRVTCGVGHFDADREDVITLIPFPSELETSDLRHTNLYLYSHVNYPENFTWTFGGSADFFENDVERDQFNPKAGLTWNPFPGTTLRGAVFRVLKRMLISNQTIEPTQVAGFNQFFDDAEGTDSWRYGAAIDQKFSAAVYGGGEWSRRELEVPFLTVVPPGILEVGLANWEENLTRAYLYWTPHPWVAAGGEYLYERFERGELGGPEEITSLKTHRFSPAVNFFHPSGFSARLKGTYVDQKGEFGNPLFGISAVPGEDQFWVVDVALGYRLPKRWGLITVEVRNAFDEEFNFQDTDPANPRIYPERFVFGRFTVAF